MIYQSAMIVLDGIIPSLPLLKYFSARADLKIYADGAASSAKRIGMKIKEFCLVGDFDSANLDELKKESSVRIFQSSDQDSTDCDKAINFALLHKVKSIDILGSEGYRFDHSFNNLYSLKRFYGKADIRIWNDQDSVVILNEGKHTIKTAKGLRVAFLPASGITNIGKASGVEYPVSDLALGQDGNMSVSNRATSDIIEIEIMSGWCFLVVENNRLNF